MNKDGFGSCFDQLIITADQQNKINFREMSRSSCVDMKIGFDAVDRMILLVKLSHFYVSLEVEGFM